MVAAALPVLMAIFSLSSEIYLHYGALRVYTYKRSIREIYCFQSEIKLNFYGCHSLRCLSSARIYTYKNGKRSLCTVITT